MTHAAEGTREGLADLPGHGPWACQARGCGRGCVTGVVHMCRRRCRQVLCCRVLRGTLDARQKEPPSQPPDTAPEDPPPLPALLLRYHRYVAELLPLVLPVVHAALAVPLPEDVLLDALEALASVTYVALPLRCPRCCADGGGVCAGRSPCPRLRVLRQLFVRERAATAHELAVSVAVRAVLLAGAPEETDAVGPDSPSAGVEGGGPAGVGWRVVLPSRRATSVWPGAGGGPASGALPPTAGGGGGRGFRVCESCSGGGQRPVLRNVLRWCPGCVYGCVFGGAKGMDGHIRVCLGTVSASAQMLPHQQRREMD